MLNPDYIIYALIDPTTGHIRYIGLTTKGVARPMRHCTNGYKKDNTRRSKWTRSLIARGIYPEWRVIEYCESKQDLSNAEKFWIKHCREIGCPLVNHTDGGFDGVPNEETRLRLRESHIQTHCKRGHEFTSANTLTNSKPNTKLCRLCNTNWHRDRQRAKRSGVNTPVHRCSSCGELNHNMRTCEFRQNIRG